MFITFEGGEGSGKTTIIRAVNTYLKEKGLKVYVTREPGGSLIAEDIRHIILDNKNTALSPKTEALLFAASRAQHLDEIILPKLEKGYIVLCDRYLDSSLAYQGYARNLGIDAVLKVNHYAVEHLPNYTIYIDSDPEKGLQRAISRGGANRLDHESLAFHRKVREGYLLLAKTYSDRFIVVDGNCNIDTLTKRTLDKIKELL
ncbi:MAG: dTMP kinase [Acholeplasmataceae bacterium]